MHANGNTGAKFELVERQSRQIRHEEPASGVNDMDCLHIFDTTTPLQYFKIFKH